LRRGRPRLLGHTRSAPRTPLSQRKLTNWVTQPSPRPVNHTRPVPHPANPIRPARR
jgi:hypothetical protein